jgi:hypothetical protein
LDILGAICIRFNNMKDSVLILLLFSLMSCKNKFQQNSFEIDLPDNYQPKESIFEVKKIAEHIGLDDLENSSDTLILRIYTGFGIVAGTNVYEIKFKDSLWSGTHYFFQGKAFIRSYLKNRQHDGFNDEADSIWIAKRFNPLCGWDKFIDTINSSGILNLPDEDDIPDCKIAELDGETYVFEWSNKSKYRYYTFWASSNSPCIESKTFQNFRSFFTSQLGFFETCWPRCWVENK